MAREIQVAIVEDQDATREGLAILIRSTPGFAVAGEFRSMEAALQALESSPPDVGLFDIGLPGVDGIEGVRRTRARGASFPILMLTVHADNDHVFEAICAGACGYLLKDTPPDRLLAAIRELYEGGAPMTPEIARKVVNMFTRVAPPPREDHGLSAREHEVLVLLSDGHSYKTAARALSVSIDTVRFHVRHIYEKLHVHSKSEAVLVALRRGLVH